MGRTERYVKMLLAAANAGADRARYALSKIMDREVEMSGVEAMMKPLQEMPEVLGDVESEVVAILMELTPDAPGNILLLIYFDSAMNIAEQLLSTHCSSDEEISELTSSALEETGNMMMSSFLSAIAEQTGIPLEPLPPLISQGPCGAVMDYIIVSYDQYGEDCVFIKTDFSDYAQSLKAFILFLPFPETAERLMSAAEALDAI